MRIIYPAEISAKIMTIIDEAEKELVIISPYNNITGWEKLIRRIGKAKAKGITILWYSRKNNVSENNAKEVISNLGINPILVEDLHAKLYMNERSAIFTSMNMSKVSDEKSLDLGYITENQKEYDEVRQIYKKYIEIEEQIDKAVEQKNEKTQDTIKNDLATPDELSDMPHYKFIHDYIIKHYSVNNFKFSKRPDEMLEYQDFIKTGIRLQITPYSKAIRVMIWLSAFQSSQKLEKQLSRSMQSFQLKYPKEFDYGTESTETYFKYYHPEYDKKIEIWDKKTVDTVMRDIDTFVKLVISNIA